MLETVDGSGSGGVFVDENQANCGSILATGNLHLSPIGAVLQQARKPKPAAGERPAIAGARSPKIWDAPKVSHASLVGDATKWEPIVPLSRDSIGVQPKTRPHLTRRVVPRTLHQIGTLYIQLNNISLSTAARRQADEFCFLFLPAFMTLSSHAILLPNPDSPGIDTHFQAFLGENSRKLS